MHTHHDLRTSTFEISSVLHSVCILDLSGKSAFLGLYEVYSLIFWFHLSDVHISRL